MKLSKKVIAAALASMMVLSMTACGNTSSAPTSASTDTAKTEAAAPEAETAAPDATAEAEADAANVEEAAGEGGTIGVCIYKFDDAFMTTYRNALQEILEGKGYSVTFMDGKNDQAEQDRKSVV